MIPMTPEAALENAVKALYEARHEPDPGRAATLVRTADVWARLHATLVNAPKETEPAPLLGDDDAYEALRRDVVKMKADLALMVKANGGRVEGGEPSEIDRLRMEVARQRATVYRMVSIPRWPENAPDNETGRAYTNGWQACRALVDKALLPEEERAE